jgi:hypothetical protein
MHDLVEIRLSVGIGFVTSQLTSTKSLLLKKIQEKKEMNES